MSETPAERLRSIVGVMNNSRESVFDNLSIFGIINLIEACRASQWDIFPDVLSSKLIKEAAFHGPSDEVVKKIDTYCEGLEKKGKL